MKLLGNKKSQIEEDNTINKEKKEKIRNKKEKKEKKEKKKGKKKWFLRIFLIIVAAVILFLIYRSLNPSEEILAVSTALPTNGEISSTLSTSGTIESEEVKYYFSPVTSKAGELFFEEGDLVSEDDLLLSYDTEDMEANLEKTKLQYLAEAAGYKDSLVTNQESQVDLTAAENNIANVEPMIEFQEDYIAQLQDTLSTEKTDDLEELNTSKNSIDIQITKVSYEISNVTHTAEELEALNLQLHNLSLTSQSLADQISMIEYDDDYVSQQELITEQQDVLTGLQDFLTEQKTLKTEAEAGVLTANSKARIQYNLEYNELSEEEAEAQLSLAEEGITADFNGVINSISVVEGSTVNEGTQMFVLSSMDKVQVTISISKYDLEDLEVGQEAVVTINNKEYEGIVSNISHIATVNSTGATTVNAQVHILEPDDNIFLGMEGKVEITTATKKDVLMVPIEAVNSGNDGDFVYVVVDGIAQKKMVTTGISSDLYIEITDGLDSSDVVITTISTELQEGTVVVSLGNTEM